jgi:hypothetical protein
MFLWAIYIFPRFDLPILLQEICEPILGIYKSLTDAWIGNFPEKDYINGIFVAVYESLCLSVCESLGPLCLNNRTETTTMPNGGNWPSTNHVTNMAEGG